ncbi:MAG: hypothetical protein O7D91_18200, partial [Planctomycetota bacterium]|nr:hypothetical protein [Planctomycetota bacterium]
MSNLNKVLGLCACCLCLTASNAALADYIGLVHVTKADDDIVNLCNNANGDFVLEPLDVCNVLAQFDNPVDRLLNTGNADITASNGLYFQHSFNSTVIAPTCFFIENFPDLICDSFVTIGYKCGPDPVGTDGTAADGSFNGGEFANNGHVVGGWFNGAPPNGQGDAGTWPCLQVLLLQLSVPTGESITGTIDVFATINDEIVQFGDQVVDCSGAQDCPQGAACYDCDPCTVDDTCDADGNCVGTPLCPPGEVCVDGVCEGEGCTPGKACDDGNPCTVDDTCDADQNCIGTPVDCGGAGDECNSASCDPNGADGNCDILTPEPDGTACGNANDTDCDNPDTCDGAGACQENLEPSGTSCPDDGNDCTDDVCDGSGTCTHPNLPDGTGCDDGQACTDSDQCTAGSCGGTDVDCSAAGDQCN